MPHPDTLVAWGCLRTRRVKNYGEFLVQRGLADATERDGMLKQERTSRPTRAHPNWAFLDEFEPH